MSALSALVLGGIALLSAVATRAARSYALSKQLIDTPNHRSSHAVPIPRGGGISLALAWFVAVAAFARPTLSPLTAALFFGGLLISLLGWLADQGRASVRFRLSLQFMAVTALVLAIGAPESVSFGLAALPLGPLAIPVVITGIVWIVNLYNFMDGVDGIAATQAVVAGAAMGAILLVGGAPELALLSFALAAAGVGFIRWNWPPARVFMGDVGSGLLGFAFGAIALAGSQQASVALPLLLLPLGPFIADATGTLVRRAIRGERVYLAHRRHLYQRLAQAGWSHKRISAVTGAIAFALSGLAFWGAGGAGRTTLALGLGVGGLLLVGAILSRIAVDFDDAPGSKFPG